MRPAILLTGKNGQVGRELERLLPQVGEVTALGREQLDLSRPDEIRRAIQSFRPALIVNAAAYTAVDKAETEENIARSVNADTVAVMAEEAKKIGSAVVHYSTDYVFDGLKAVPYDENDAPNPVNVYGKTKLEGELAIQQSGVPHLIFRTSWIYSTSGRNFLLTILRLAAEKEELRVVRDQIGAPTWSREIASATVKILGRLYGQSRETISDFSGLYHMTAAGETSWHEFAGAILAEALLAPEITPWIIRATGDKPLIARRVIRITTQEYPTAAIRPRYSVLSNHRLMEAFGIEMQDWRAGLRSAFESSGEAFGA
jgi:dTDP-4-dehydrorhamnose reductase